MTYQYARLAVGIKPQFRDAGRTVPCDEHGNELYYTDFEEKIKCWCKKVIHYEIRDDVMYCWLDMKGELA